MAEPGAEGARVIRPVVSGQRLVHAHALEPSGGGLDRVEHGHRLAVGRLHDEVGSGRM